MKFEERAALADDLYSRVIEVLSPELLTGTGEQYRERRDEMLRLAAKVAGAVMYDEMPEDEQVRRTRALHQKLIDALGQGGRLWLASSANDEDAAK